ncbi:hypothetical protein ACP4OV_028848 [Aristida adscensionis]
MHGVPFSRRPRHGYYELCSCQHARHLLIPFVVISIQLPSPTSPAKQVRRRRWPSPVSSTPAPSRPSASAPGTPEAGPGVVGDAVSAAVKVSNNAPEDVPEAIDATLRDLQLE